MTTDPDDSEPGPDSVMPARVQSVDRALRLLEVVAATAPRGETVTTLAARCEINRATAWRLLGTLEARGLVERDPNTNRYRIGLAMIRMSASAGYDGLVRRTRHVLERVSEQTGETADLAVVGRHGVTYVGEVAPPSVMAINWVAREVPLHATSTGKAFLAWLPPDEARGLLDLPLPRYTDTTVTDPDVLMAELDGIREQGYAECAGELEPALYGVSAPILTVDARPLGVFSIWGPVSRVPVTRFAELGPIAVEAAAEVRTALQG
ncbi:MAG TPA: IclR family transcriptional regulator [Nocardioides sp.]|uniref:IclR family transcriptional regulator n=1 Tax=Nocardioides sp. TaxID=35761 RepID=UPI002E2FB166|nr:IclR family transcriptional regulator [Nocardioides sp.]HEX3931707.1 IclR family transcriptional regulator [Nocardioides sp.]